MNRAFRTVPPLVALILYWPGLTAWFQKDDFAWLGLRGLIHDWHDFWWTLFAPLAQGTIRTLSERIYYLSFFSAFGLHAFPYRCWAFLTGVATIILLNAVCVKLTGSRAAGFWAAFLWTVNAAVSFAFSWTAIYYELLCSFFFLLDLWLLLRYAETRERRFYVAQWATFVIGFGVLELNVVYPALALAYALCRARFLIPKILPLFALSAAYTAIHMAVAPLQPAGPYRMFWDTSAFGTLWIYWKLALGPNRLTLLGIYPSLFRSSLTAALMAGMLCFLVCKLCRREWLAAFFPAWFVIVMAPLLPLRNHISDYYLTPALLGLAMWGAWAIVSGWQDGAPGRIAAASLVTIYLCVSLPVARANTVGFSNRSHQIERLLVGIVDLGRRAPGKLILLKGVDAPMFWDAFFHRPLRLYGLNDVYLEPAAGPPPEEFKQFLLDPARLKTELARDRVLVLDTRGGAPRDVTASYR